MTVIAAAEGEDGAAIAADSFWGTIDDYTLVKGKIIRLNPRLFVGVSGSLRVAQVIRYHMRIKPPRDGQDPEDWGVTSFVPKLQNLWERHNLPEKDSDGTPGGPTALVVAAGYVLELQADWSIARSIEGYSSCGAGCSLALGNLAGSQGKDPLDRAVGAVEFTCQHSPFCKPPVWSEWCPR